MTDPEIERLAREAGLRSYQEKAPGIDGAVGDWDALARFAELIEAHERERCAKVCEDTDERMHNDAQECNGYDCSRAIRAL